MSNFSDSGRSRTFLLTYVIAAIVAGAFVFGVLVGREGHAPPATEATSSTLILGPGSEPPQDIGNAVDMNLFWSVWRAVKERYVRQPVPDQTLLYGAMKGLVEALDDPYSSFLKPQIATEFAQELSGAFEGIGAEIGIREEGLVIVAPLPETPAARAGLKPGDVVLAIDGADTGGMTLEEAVSRIRGVRGTVVTLSIFRKVFEAPQDFKMSRDRIEVRSVTVEFRADGITHLTVSQFNDETLSQWDKAVRQIIKKKPRGIVLDVRNNPGGFLDVGVRVASEWIEAGPVVIERFSDGRDAPYERKGPDRLRGLKTVVLINGGSASAAEIVAGALQDYGAAKAVGEQTFGKGSVQDFEQLSDGSALKLTVAEWQTPKGRSINEQGIAPDVVVETSDDLTHDPQLEAAVQLLLQ